MVSCKVGISAYHLYALPFPAQQKAERRTELTNWRPPARPDNLVRGKWIDKGLPDCGLPDGNCWLARHADINWTLCRSGALYGTQGAGRCSHRFVHAGGHRSVAVWTLHVESSPTDKMPISYLQAETACSGYVCQEWRVIVFSPEWNWQRDDDSPRWGIRPGTGF